MKIMEFRNTVSDTEVLRNITDFIRDGHRRGVYVDPQCILFSYDPKTEIHILTLVYEEE